MADDSMFDKVVEMGMGMAMLNQIPRMMNSVTPQQGGQPTPPPVQGAGIQLYAVIDNSQAGPFTEQEFTTLIQKGMISKDTLVWKPGLANWMPASQVPEVSKLLLLNM